MNESKERINSNSNSNSSGIADDVGCAINATGSIHMNMNMNGVVGKNTITVKSSVPIQLASSNLDDSFVSLLESLKSWNDSVENESSNAWLLQCQRLLSNVVAQLPYANTEAPNALHALHFIRSLVMPAIEIGNQEPSAFIQFDFPSIFPYFFSFLSLLASPSVASPTQIIFANALMETTECFITLVHRRTPNAASVLASLKLDVEFLLSQLESNHVEFNQRMRHASATIDQVDISSYCLFDPNATFEFLTLTCWSNLRQLASCETCHSTWKEEETHRSSFNQIGNTSAHYVPNCTCSVQLDTKTRCSCLISSVFLSQSPPARLSSSHLLQFTTLNLALHSREINIKIQSLQQLHFFTEKLLQLYLCLLKVENESPSQARSYCTSAHTALERYRIFLCYASLPDPILRGAALQIIPQLIISVSHSFPNLSSLPSTVAHPLLVQFLVSALETRAHRGNMRVASEVLPDVNAQHEYTKAQALEDDRLQSVLEAILTVVPYTEVESSCHVLMQLALKCLKHTPSLAFAHSLIQMCTTMLCQSPHLWSQLMELYSTTVAQLDRLHAIEGSPVQTPLALQACMMHCASELFKHTALAVVWLQPQSPLIPSSLISTVSSMLFDSADKNGEMPQLESATDSATNQPVAKRMKVSHTMELVSSVPMDTDSPLPVASTETAISASTQSASVISLLHSLFYRFLHEALPPTASDASTSSVTVTSDSIVSGKFHPSQLSPNELILSLFRLHSAAQLLCDQIDNGSLDHSTVASSPICNRLRDLLLTWIKWLNLVASNHQTHLEQLSAGATATGPFAAYFPRLPTLLQLMYSTFELCSRSFPSSFFDSYQLEINHLCAWPLEEVASRKKPQNNLPDDRTAHGVSSSTSPACVYPLSLVAASLRLLCSIRVNNSTNELKLMRVALESDDTALQCTGIAVLPALLRRLAIQDKPAKGRAYLQMLRPLAASVLDEPQAAVSATQTQAKPFDVSCAIGQVLGPLICALHATDIASNNQIRSIRRPRQTSFLPPRYANSLLIAATPLHATTSTNNTSKLVETRFTFIRERNLWHQLNEYRQRVSNLSDSSDMDLNSQMSAHSANSNSSSNQPLWDLFAPLLSRVQCNVCDGMESACCSKPGPNAASSWLCFRRDIVPFFSLFRPAYSIAARFHMARSLFRIIRHLPSDELLHTLPTVGSSHSLGPVTPPPNRVAHLSPQSRSKAPQELPFSLSQMAGGSGKKAKAIHHLQSGLNSTPSAASANGLSTIRGTTSESQGSGSQNEDLMDTSLDGISDGAGPVIHPLVVQIMLLLFDPSHVIRQAVVENMEMMMNEDNKAGRIASRSPFFILMTDTGAATAAATAGQNAKSSVDSSTVHQCFHNFIHCLTHIQINAHLLPSWHQKFDNWLSDQSSKNISSSKKKLIDGIEFDLRLQPVISKQKQGLFQGFDCFHVDVLLTTFAAMSQLASYTPLGSSTQQLMVWPLVEALSHAIESQQPELKQLALSYFNRIAAAYRLSTSGLFFLHSRYLFEKMFETQLLQTPQLLPFIFEHIVLQQQRLMGQESLLDSTSSNSMTRLLARHRASAAFESIQLHDFYREGVRMTLPAMILRNFDIFCDRSSSSYPVIARLAAAASFDNAPTLQTALVSVLDSILSSLFRSPSSYTAGFIHNQFIPFFNDGLRASIRHVLDLVVFVRSDVLFELIWRSADESQQKQSKQVMSWIIQGDPEKQKMAAVQQKGGVAGKMHSYMTPAPIVLSANAAAQPFALTAPVASTSQISDLLLPYFLGIFTKLHALLAFNPVLTQTEGTIASGPVVQVPGVYKVHAIHALAVLIQLTRDRLKGFIPKILASMQLFTTQLFKDTWTPQASPTDQISSPIQFHFLCLWTTLIETLLVSNNLSEYLSTIVVTLVDVLGKLHEQERQQPSSIDVSSMDTSDSNHSTSTSTSLRYSISDFFSYRSSLPPLRVSDKPDLYLRWISSLPEELLEQALEPVEQFTPPAVENRPALSASDYRAHCIAHLTQLLTDLLFNPRRNKDIHSLLKTIPPLPPYPSIAAVQLLFQQEFQSEVERRVKEIQSQLPVDPGNASASGNKPASLPPASLSRGRDSMDGSRMGELYHSCSFHLHLERLMPTIAHESDQVRHFTLKHLLHLIRDTNYRACWDSYYNTQTGGVFSAQQQSSGMFGQVRLNDLLSALLQRCTDIRTDTRLIASECLGEIGAIDPGLLTGNVVVKSQFTTPHEAHHRTTALAHYLIQHMLVRALRSATETVAQDQALCAIQQLLKYCGIDRGASGLAEKHQLNVNGTAKVVPRNQIEGDFARVLDQRLSSEYLPHSTLGVNQQYSQLYQALELWLEFPYDVRTIIAPCLTSAYSVNDILLQPRITNAQALTFKLEHKSTTSDSAAGGSGSAKKSSAGSARKRKDPTSSSSYELQVPELDDSSSNKRSTRSTPERKKSTVTTATNVVTDDSTRPVLTASTIRPLPSKPIYNRKLTMPQWLAQFTRYLIAYTAIASPTVPASTAAAGAPGQAPSFVSETLLYQSCIGVVQSDVSTALFLLPYLVDHALRYGSDAFIEFIRREILCVLHAHVSTNRDSTAAANRVSDKSVESLAASSSAPSFAHSSAQMCIQAVFELLDTLHKWFVAERRAMEQARAQMNSAVASNASSHSSGSDSSRSMLPQQFTHNSMIPPPNVPSPPFPSNRPIEAYKQFIDSIPKQVLAMAAFQCKAFTRACKYMESYLRDERDKWKVMNEKRMAIQHSGKTRGRATMTSALAAASSASSVSGTNVSINAVDGASIVPSEGLIFEGIGAGLQISDLDSFQHMYASLEEPDGMRGLALLRPKQSVASNIKDLESLGKWADALTCYENSLQIDSTQLHAHVGMMECFRNLGQWRAGLAHAQSLMLKPNYGEKNIRQVAVFAVQNAWRLKDWSTVGSILSSDIKVQPEPSNFEVRLAALLLAVHTNDNQAYQAELRRCRKAVLSPLTVASWESYERTYPYLLQLQMIAEVDQMRNVFQDHRRTGSHSSPPVHSSPTPYLSPAVVRDSLSHLSSAWSARLRRTTQTFRIREQLLCLRRVLYSQFDLQSECGMGWLQLAHQARKAQQFEVAQGALMHATQMNVPNTFIERARLLRERGQLHDALLYLEKEAPSDTKDTRTQSTAVSNSIVMSQGTIDASFKGATPAVKACLSATIYLLLGKWIQESSAKESRDVITLYGRAIHFQPKWEKAHFLLGKYYDELLAAESNRSRFGTLHSKQQQQLESDRKSSSSAATAAKSKSASGASPDVVSKFLGAILKSYGSSLAHGHKYLFQSMPRILTLWFEHSESQWDGTLSQNSQIGSAASSAAVKSATTASSTSRSQPNNLAEKFSQCHYFLCDLIKTLPAYQWLTAFPQIISRLTHSRLPVYQFIKDIILKVFTDYPQQAIWMLAVVTKSVDPVRITRSREILTAVRRVAPVSTNALLDRALTLFDQLIKVCNFMPKQKKNDISIKEVFPQLHQMQKLPLIVPLQNQMTVSLPPLSTDNGGSGTMETQLNGSLSYDNHYQQIARSYRAFPSNQVTIDAFCNEMEVLKSKEKPKKLSLLGSDGVMYLFLCKKEIKGDMRKNSRMMEFNTVVNRLLQESGDSRSRHLALRTFSVLPMTEECGLIEWVPHTTGFRHLVRQTHDEEGIQTCFATIKRMYEESAQQIPNDVANEVKLYERLCELYKPVFHKWFLSQFQEPHAWFQARLKFARSSAVWSMVGYVVGLGDRHGENILIDETSGDCVHVDFDCLFGKGLTLDKPERVPFRLTPNMVDALGISGVEGLFSSSAEVTMQVMRSNEQTMMSVLHTFIYDPLVEWKNLSPAAAAAPVAAVGMPFNPNAVKILDEIEMKLRGQVAKESLPLNVPGQVAQLIKEATSPINLAQMYIGWMAWL